MFKKFFEIYLCRIGKEFYHTFFQCGKVPPVAANLLCLVAEQLYPLAGERAMAMERATWAQLVDILCIIWKMLFGGKVKTNRVSRQAAQNILKGDHESFAREFVRLLEGEGRFGPRERIKWRIRDGIIHLTVVSSDTTGAGWIALSEEAGVCLDERTKQFLMTPEFATGCVFGIEYDIAVIPAWLFKGEITREVVERRAEAMGFSQPPATVACLLWKGLRDELERMGVTCITVMHDPIPVDADEHCRYRLAFKDSGLIAGIERAGFPVIRDCAFAFLTGSPRIVGAQEE